jgi:hypothetical protein
MWDPVHYNGGDGEEVDLGYRKIASGLRAVVYTPYLKSAMLIPSAACGHP